MRPIDADALLNEAEYDSNFRLIIPADKVKNAPTIPKPSNEPLTDTWISAEERLPKEHEPVLCVVNGKPRGNIILEDAYQLGSWNRADGWIIDEWLEWENANVSWWCELPEPPGCRPPEGECT